MEPRTPEQMNESADIAEAEYKQMADKDGVNATSLHDWLERWYLDAGWKRLGRIMLKYGK